MVIALRIIRAISRGDGIYLELSKDGIEEAGVGVVVFDTEQIKSHRPEGTASYEQLAEGGGFIIFDDHKRPTVIANNLEMKLREIKTNSVYSIYTVTKLSGQQATTTWSASIKPKKHKFTVDPPKVTISMLLEWE